MILYWIILLFIAVLSYTLGSMSTMVLSSNFVFRASLTRLGNEETWISNFTRLYGKFGFVKLLLVEAVRDAVPILVGGLLMGLKGNAEIGRSFAAFCLVFGRLFPLFYNFKGSHASLCLIAAGFAVNVSVGIVVMIAVGAVTWFTRYMSLGAIVGAVLLIMACVLMIDISIVVWLNVITGGFVILHHIPAVSRMINGTEKKFSTEKDMSYKFDERF